MSMINLDTIAVGISAIRDNGGRPDSVIASTKYFKKKELIGEILGIKLYVDPDVAEGMYFLTEEGDDVPTS